MREEEKESIISDSDDSQGYTEQKTEEDKVDEDRKRGVIKDGRVEQTQRITETQTMYQKN